MFDYEGHLQGKVLINIIADNLGISKGETKSVIMELAEYLKGVE